MPFQIIRNDITKTKADAIVNTANPHVTIGSGTDAAIYKAAGKEKLLAERKKIGELAVGQAAYTDAFDLPAKYIIHVCGPRYIDGKHQEEELLSLAYRNALELAASLKCRSIAFPLMAAGTYHFPKEEAMRIAVNAFMSFLQKEEMDIILVVFEAESYKISGRLFNDVKSFVDEAEIEENLDMEYGGIEREPVSYGTNLSAPMCASSICEEDLEGELKKAIHDSLPAHLRQLINKKSMKNSDVYNGAGMSKQYFSKLMKGTVKPSKEKLLALAIGLHLNEDETRDLLAYGGYAFSPVSQTDIVVRYFIQHKNYSIINVNIMLFDFGLDGLTSGQ